MEMVAVGFVIVGRENGGEEAAGAVANLAQEAGLGIVAHPVGDHPHPAAVGEDEAGDVDRIGGGMLAPRAFVAAAGCG
jgi:hypothetical protein